MSQNEFSYRFLPYSVVSQTIKRDDYKIRFLLITSSKSELIATYTMFCV